MKKLLNQINLKSALVLSAAVALSACGKEQPRKDFVARVENSYLTSKDLAADLDTAGLEPSRKNEYVRNWIETELLYKEASSENVMEEKEYLKTLEKAKRELARAFLINKILDENKIELKDKELEEFFSSHREEFRLFQDTYYYNLIKFKDEDKAVFFRTALMEGDWMKASNAVSGDRSVISENPGILKSDYQIQPNSLLLSLQGLMPGETSIVLNTEPSVFTVVQLKRKYSTGEIPDFDVVKSQVKERLLLRRKQKMLSEHIKGLYSKYKVEIK
ncbi:MAG: peptidyl-prolyl cis-trans isomerase [Acidobacteriota bacterium]